MARSDSRDLSLLSRRATSGSGFLNLRRGGTSSIESDHPRTRDGLQTLTESSSRPRATIIFVHGLGGDLITTWCHERDPYYFWPQRWLPHERGIEDVRICSFGYAADFTSSRTSTATIADFAKKLNLDLLTHNFADAPLIFVAHSMGGLVVKKAHMLAIQDANYRDVASMTKRGAIVFLSTPHRGSDSASLLNRVLSATVGSKAFVQELVRNSHSLTTINEDFRHCVKDLSIYSFREILPTSIGAGRSMIIVDADSAVLGYPGEISSHIDADHHSICKYSSENSPGYQSIKRLLIHRLELIDQSASATIPSRPALQAPERRRSQYGRRLAQILGQENLAEDDLLFFRDLRTESDSCQWFLSRPTFQWLVDSDGSQRSPTQYLWLRGHPAVGKSVLMSSVVDHLISRDCICGYYFFRGNNSTRNTTRAFMISIISQMAMAIPEFYERLREIDEEHANIHSMTNRTLWQKIIIETMFDMGTEKPIFWVIDGLDEAAAPAEVIQLCSKIKSRTPVKILLSSRDSADMETHFKPLRPPSFTQDMLRPEDTKEDMLAFVERQLESQQFDDEERQEIASLIVTKAHGLFLWAKLAIGEITSALTKEEVYEALENMPWEMTDFFEQILEKMSQLQEKHRRIAKAILELTICSIRPLKTAQLQVALEKDFGKLLKLEWTIKTVCPHLLRVDESTFVQPIHATVRYFMLNETQSEFRVDEVRAHHRLFLMCTRIWSGFDMPISQSPHLRARPNALDRVQPLLRYASQSWFEHLARAEADFDTIDSLLGFLQRHVLYWMEAVGLLRKLQCLTSAAQGLDKFVSKCGNLLPHNDRKMILGWAIDLVRIAPKYGRNIIAYPFSVHKLLPPFCPRQTSIASQFARFGDIEVVGPAVNKWDDCLAHITVGRRGERCKALACSQTHIAVGLEDAKGTVVIYQAETCQEQRRFQLGERLGALSIDATDQRLVTGSLNFTKVWHIRTQHLIASLPSAKGARCLAVGFRPDSKQVVIVSSNHILTIWDIGTHECETMRWARPTEETRYRGTPWGVTINQDGSKVALAYKGWPLEIWDIDNRRLAQTIDMRNPLATSLNPVNDDSYSVDEDGSLTHFRAENGSRKEIDAQSHILACNPSGTLLAAGNGEGCLKLYDADELKLLYRLDKYDDSINGLAFSPDGQRLYDIRYSDCNIWVPEVLFVSVEDKASSSEESEGYDIPGDIVSSSLLESNAMQNITTLVTTHDGGFIHCGNSAGKINCYDAKNGRRVQTLYKHAPTVTIRALCLSGHGTSMASADDSGRIIAVKLQLDQPNRWKVAIVLDTRLDIVVDGTICQLLLDAYGDRLLVSAKETDQMLDLASSKVIERHHGLDVLGESCWMIHPLDESMLIQLTLGRAHVFAWDGFARLSEESGIEMAQQDDIYGSDAVAEINRDQVKIRAFPSEDKSQIAISSSVAGNRGVTQQGTFWNTEDFNPANSVITPTGDMHNSKFDELVGVYKNRAVFIDTELWVCSKGQNGPEAPTRHFYVPFDWLNTSEERPSLMTPLGDFVYAKHGELIVVKRGMRCKQDFTWMATGELEGALVPARHAS